MKITREDLIQKMAEDVETWDFHTLISFAFDQMNDYYQSLTDDELKEEYHNFFDEFENIEFI